MKREGQVKGGKEIELILKVNHTNSPIKEMMNNIKMIQIKIVMEETEHIQIDPEIEKTRGDKVMIQGGIKEVEVNMNQMMIVKKIKKNITETHINKIRKIQGKKEQINKVREVHKEIQIVMISIMIRIRIGMLPLSNIESIQTIKIKQILNIQTIETIEKIVMINIKIQLEGMTQ